MIVKSLKVFTLFMIVVSFYVFFTYFNSLDFKTDPSLKTCWAIALKDAETGEAVVGVEDVAFDPVEGTVFLSAYDRRLVRDQLDGTSVTARGGLYSFQISELAKKPETLQVRNLSADFPDDKFLPHGIGFSAPVNRRQFMTVNRVYADDSPPDLEALLQTYRWDGEVLTENGTQKPPMICNPNDLDIYWNGFFVTNDRSFCHKDLGLWEQFWDETGSVYRYRNGEFELIDKDLPFPNGVAVVKRRGGDYLAVALTRAEKIRLYEISTGKLVREITVPGAPDNLTVDAKGNIYYTIFPNLMDYYFYTREKMFVKKSPTGVFRIFAQSNWNTTELLFHDDGDIISGATVAIRAKNFLIMGSGWDDNIAACSGMNALGDLEEFEERHAFF